MTVKVFPNTFIPFGIINIYPLKSRALCKLELVCCTDYGPPTFHIILPSLQDRKTVVYTCIV